MIDAMVTYWASVAKLVFISSIEGGSPLVLCMPQKVTVSPANVCKFLLSYRSYGEDVQGLFL